MKSIAIFYASTSGHTKTLAQTISDKLDSSKIYDINITGPEYINDYTNIIFGISDREDLSMQEHWNEIWNDFLQIDFREKNVAIFGLGNQKNSKNNFVDSMYPLYKHLKESKANILGFTSTDKYDFIDSKACINGQFVGLAIDVEDKDHLNEIRINNWVEDLKKVFD